MQQKRCLWKAKTTHLVNVINHYWFAINILIFSMESRKYATSIIQKRQLFSQLIQFYFQFNSQQSRIVNNVRIVKHFLNDLISFLNKPQQSNADKTAQFEYFQFYLKNFNVFVMLKSTQDTTIFQFNNANGQTYNVALCKIFQIVFKSVLDTKQNFLISSEP